MYRSRIGSSTSSSTSGSGISRKCQKCLKSGHATYECKNPRPYQSRPTRSQAFNDPKLLKKLREKTESVRIPEELRKTGTADSILAKRASERDAKSKEIPEKGAKARKRGRSMSTDSSSSSYSSSPALESLSSSSQSPKRRRRQRRSRSRSQSVSSTSTSRGPRRKSARRQRSARCLSSFSSSSRSRSASPALSRRTRSPVSPRSE